MSLFKIIIAVFVTPIFLHSLITIFILINLSKIDRLYEQEKIKEKGQG